MFALQSWLSEKLTSVTVDSHYLYRIDFKPKLNFSDSRLEVNFLQFFIYSAPDWLSQEPFYLLGNGWAGIKILFCHTLG